MLALLPAVLLALASSSAALVPYRGAHFHRRHNGVAHNVSFVPRSTSYKLVDHYANDTFFE